MLIPHHPQPVPAPKTVATQVVQQRRNAAGPVDKTTIVVDTPSEAPAPGNAGTNDAVESR